MMVVLKKEVWDDLKAWLRFWRCWKRSSSDEEEGEWKLILLEKWSTTLEPGEKRGNVGLKQFLMLSRHLLTSLIGLLRLAHCLFVSLEVVTLCGGWFFACCESSSKLMACEDEIVPYLRWCLPLSLRIWRVTGMRPAMASMPSEGDVQKAPVIQRAALHCIFLSLLMFLTIGVPLKNQRLNPYSAIGRMQVLYRSRFLDGK